MPSLTRLFRPEFQSLSGTVLSKSFSNRLALDYSFGGSTRLLLVNSWNGCQGTTRVVFSSCRVRFVLPWMQFATPKALTACQFPVRPLSTGTWHSRVRTLQLSPSRSGRVCAEFAKHGVSVDEYTIACTSYDTRLPSLQGPHN